MPTIDQIAALFHADNTGFGSCVLADSSLNHMPMRLRGGAALSSAWSKFGGASAHNDGTGYCSTSISNAALSIGAGVPFAAEGFVNIDNPQPNGYPLLMSMANGVDGTWGPGTFQVYANRADYPGKITVWCNNFNTGSPLLSGSSSLLGAGAKHFAVTRDASNVVRLFVNGVVEASATFTGAITGASPYLFLLGSNEGALTHAKGYMDEFRLVVGDPVYTAAFTPPTAAFSADEVSGLTVHPVAEKRLPGIAPPMMGARPLGHLRRRHGGAGFIAGEVDVIGTPNTPVGRRVRLYRDLDGQLIDETWSDVSTGAYRFEALPLAGTYSVIADDYTLNYNSAVKARVTPEAAS